MQRVAKTAAMAAWGAVTAAARQADALLHFRMVRAHTRPHLPVFRSALLNRPTHPPEPFDAPCTIASNPTRHRQRNVRCYTAVRAPGGV
eukprot:365270-Chlamydomonas_euryale.AAC.13